MYVAQEVNRVVRRVDKEQRDHSVELSVLGEHVQKVALDEFDGLVWPVVRYR